MIHELAILNFLFCITLYGGMLIYRFHLSKSSHQVLLKMLYRQWPDRELKKGKPPLEVIKTLKILLYTNIFFIFVLITLIGASILLFSNLLYNRTTMFLGISDFPIGLFQFFLLLIIIFFGLFNFVFSLKNSNNFISSISEDFHKEKDVDTLEQSFISILVFQMLGIRCLLYLGPTLAWLIHPLIYIIITILLTIFLVLFQDRWIIKP